ncbi:hypothetical protein COLO4_33916 [Corchorus olitorius]|uniref:RNase H type-1 domain-containing protein n=1 Tax=Corchorus olitorius TaxID=93759 RepID=A0A1R3GQ51_9ROSI|nr:hypothetical protein COLO4_33916 [Corchorus olitorius]
MSQELDDGSRSADGFFGATKWRDVALITSWAVWNDRNTEFHDGVRRFPQHTVEFIRSYVMEFQRCQEAVTIVSKPVTNVRWEAPLRGVIKIKFDGSFQAAAKTGSFGTVGRDCNGQIMGSVAGRFEYVADAFATEAKAAIKAIDGLGILGLETS